MNKLQSVDIDSDFDLLQALFILEKYGNFI